MDFGFYGFCGFCGIVESFNKLGFKGKEQNKNFFKILRCGIEGGFAFFACEILRFWILDSAEFWNCWLIEVCRVKGTLLLAKAKSSKNFCLDTSPFEKAQYDEVGQGFTFRARLCELGF